MGALLCPLQPRVQPQHKHYGTRHLHRGPHASRGRRPLAPPRRGPEVSYCRFCPADNPYGWLASDLYVYLDCGGYLNCCGCLLVAQGFRASRTADMSRRTSSKLASND